jgi:AraC-like DNA-binding protein
MDPITDLFKTILMSSTAELRSESASWYVLRDPDSGRSHFAHVVRGDARLSVEGISAPIHLAGGDYVMVAPSIRHSLSGSTTTLVCGQFAFDRAGSPSLSTLLPPLVHIRGDQEQGLALLTTLKMLTSELAIPGPGSEVVVTRLAEVVLIQALRAYVATGQCTERPRVLGALADPHIGKSLQAIHGAITRPWTLATLAAAAGMSRSAFAAKFKALVGETPLEYLTRWRMQTAARLLRTGEGKLRTIARAVGYHTDAAFTRAFRRVHDVSPGAYRRSVGLRSTASRSGSNLAKNVDRARGVVGDEEVAGGIDRHVNGATQVVVGVGPSGDEVDRARTRDRH